MKKLRHLMLFAVLIIISSCNGCSKDDTKYIDMPEIDPSIPTELFDLKVTSMRVRDPFILVDKEQGLYYLHVNDAGKQVKYYKSKDLRWWKDEGISFKPSEDFWAKEDFWAPDTYFYKGKYYIFITLSNLPSVKRGTSILVSDKPEGPYEPLVNNPVTPSDEMCLDGSLYVDENNTPWILYCHEWLEVGDGEILAQQLSDDLKTTVGEAKLLFTATEAPWVGSISSGSITGYVTDAPFIHRTEDGKLIMLWSSFHKNGKYAIGQAVSESGNIVGPWKQSEEALNDDDGGHAMIFKDLEGELMISYHSPNSDTETPTIRPIKIVNNKVTFVE